jgi:hypothetical protein
MLPSFLIPERIVREAGSGPALQVPPASRMLQVTLGINRIIEQESLDVAIVGSADGANWNTKPLVKFPQKFYCGTYTMLLDLSETPDVRFIRAEYKMNRWGRGEPQPLFGFYVFIEDTADKPALATAVA